ncbi:MAG: dTDP-4-dehydrorhamnose 3,5-epimerase [Thermodesulfovibrionales bacterium]|nr:dTDP-4-dehydrorhamnose 3,5-epimerase [Thermodesulfovibrionales bacterium]
MPFEFKRLKIPDVILIKATSFFDNRGFFLEIFKQSSFYISGIKRIFLQDNLSLSKKGVLRGLHYQKNPQAQGKLVKVLSGSILDVAVDIRKGSPYYGKWVAEVLTSKNNLMLWIPEGFAHGFLSLEDNSLVLYKNTKEYSPEHDRGIIWNDPNIAIQWGIKEPILSDKDKTHPLLENADNNFVYNTSDKQNS